jgi:hypothetical protein
VRDVKPVELLFWFQVKERKEWSEGNRSECSLELGIFELVDIGSWKSFLKQNKQKLVERMRTFIEP